jgi:Xaa-Pro aminopeptidase
LLLRGEWKGGKGMALGLEEKVRRYKIIKEKMSVQGLDALIVINSAQINEKGFVKYLTNYRSILYNLVVILPLDGEARLLVPSPVQRYWAHLLGWIPRVEDQAPNLDESLLRAIKDMGLSKARIGLINTRIMPAGTYLALTKEFPGASIIDATAVIEEVRMVKSEGEQALARTAAGLADLSFRVLSEFLKPGVTERDLVAEVDRELIKAGAEDIFHLISSKPGNLFPYAASDRAVTKGDVAIFNTELSGPGGYWVQMVRTAFVGKPKASVERMYDILIEIGSALPGQLRPGKKASEVAEWVRHEIIGAGFEIGVNFGHCLGLDVVERPLVHIKDETVLTPGMVITVHPQLVSKNKDATVWLADTYLIREGDAEVLTKVDPAEMKVVG